MGWDGGSRHFSCLRNRQSRITDGDMQRRCFGVAVTRAAATGAALAIGLAVAGCSASGPISSPSASSSAVTTNAGPTSANPSQDAQSLAVAFIPTYLRMLDDLRLDQTRPLDDIYQVAVAP